MSERVIIVPCSGIGKTYGTVTREAAYLVTEELRPETTTIVPLSLLVLGDEEARAAVQDARVITMDGCKLACATLNVRQAGGDGSQGVHRAGLLPAQQSPEAPGHQPS